MGAAGTALAALPSLLPLYGVRKEHCSGSQEHDSSLSVLPLLLLLAPAFSSIKWAWDKMVPELLSRVDNGILYEFQGGEWPQMHPLCADRALSLVSFTSSALFHHCRLSRPSSCEPKERG